MLAKIKARREDEEGFTLIELMVVVLIIAILIAIAIPTFLGARQRAQDRAAQSSVRNAFTAAKTIFTDNESYTTADATTLGNVEPSLTFVAGDVAGITPPSPNNISFAVSDTNLVGDTIVMASLSRSGKCFLLKDVATSPGAGTYYAETSGATCNAVGSAASVTNAAW